MSYQLSRLAADFRGARRWVAALAVACFVVGAVTYLMSADLQAVREEGTLSISPPSAPLSFLRLYDPEESIQQDVASLADTAVLTAPSMGALLGHVDQHDDSYVLLQLNALAPVVDPVTGESPVGRVVIGTPPASLNLHPSPAGLTLYGRLDVDSVSLSDSTIRGLPMVQESRTPPSGTLVDGHGYVVAADDQPLVVVSPHDALSLGIVAPYRASDVAEGFVCHCDQRELTALVGVMTDGDRAAGLDRAFYTSSYEQLIGPLQRAVAAGGVQNQVFALAVSLSVLTFAFVAVRLLFERRLGDFLAERNAGSTTLPMAVRMTVLTAVSVTVPLLGGMVAVRWLLADAEGLPPMPPSGAVAFAVALLVFQAVLILTVVRMLRVAVRDT